MPLDSILMFIPACFALNMVFGPNNLLSLTNAAHHGMGYAIAAAVVGRLPAFSLMILATALGLGAAMMASELLFSMVKWGGVMYLLWIGYRLLTAPESPTAADVPLDGHVKPLRLSASREFIVAAGNPKAMLVFAAFFPQFVQDDAYWQSFTVLAGIYLALEVVAIVAYAYAGKRIVGIMRTPGARRRLNRISGSVMMTFGVLLAFSRRPQ
ncbi:LysE family translocator (plasmid) [Ensifer adhaerens]|uniref:LysE family translocator n=1 Tax=Ensifer adhaerens TaxID=106592 RepID=UPI001CBF2F2F|nr:LysE family translocator [Ensifer adhaerens]MBZ7927352.1 LysE family translocator [Ensifer adhaerens]UAX98359.1 LysE family translocator [Ensifer adhaerens]UAY05742.1 LysE family translocator [Ensifer adhaerens]UAY13120.1 LysE family translocator [Ensifer adhaerens]